jgi:outer membrane protein assembly factor BamB
MRQLLRETRTTACAGFAEGTIRRSFRTSGPSAIGNDKNTCWLPARLSMVAFAAMTCLAGTPAEAASVSAEQQWPHWRGPLANGLAPHGNPPLQWSETENVKWKFKLPSEGLATPVIWGDKIFLVSAIATGKRPEGAAAQPAPQPQPQAEAPPEGQRRGGRSGRGGGRGGGGAPNEAYQFVVMCVDRPTGKLLWQKVAREEVPHQGHQQSHRFASASPVTDGEQVYVSFGSWGVYCYDFNGNLKWERDFGKMKTPFGEGTSPVVHDGKLVINWDHDGDDFIAALDTKTGQTIWKTDRTERTTWVTPAVISTSKGTQIVVPAPSKTRSYDLATGKVLWECGGQASGNVVPVPVVGHGYVFAMSGHQGNSVQAIRYDRTGDLTGTDAVAWSLSRNAPHVPSPLLYDDLIYFLSSNNPIISCYEAKTGQALYEAQRLEGMRGGYPSPVGAAGRVYLAGPDGTTLVIKKGPQLEVLATNKLDDQFQSSPAIVGKELFLRGFKQLYCIAEK